MSLSIRYTETARRDLEQVAAAALPALAAIRKGLAFAAEFPFSCRKPLEDNPFLRELLVSDDAGGWVALFEIEANHTITVLALRPQLEDDLH